MKSQTRLALIRSRALALRVSSLAVISATNGSPSVSAAPGASPSVSLPPVKSVHVWRKPLADNDKGEPLPLGFIPSPFFPFTPAIDPEMSREVAPIAYAEALPEIGFHHFAHLANCMPFALPWRG